MFEEFLRHLLVKTSLNKYDRKVFSNEFSNKIFVVIITSLVTSHHQWQIFC